MGRWVLSTWPDREWRWASEESLHTPWKFSAFSWPGNHTVPVGKGGCRWPSLPVRDSLQGPAVAAGQPERAVRQHVGAVRDAEDEQVAARRLQQGLQPGFQAAPARDGGSRVRHGRPRSHSPWPPQGGDMSHGDLRLQDTQNPQQELVCDACPSVEMGHGGSWSIIIPEDQHLQLREEGARDAGTHRVLFM